MKYSLILLVLLLVGCSDFWAEQEDKHIKWRLQYMNGIVEEMHIVEKDSCEYLVSGKFTTLVVTHKGNCKYCEARKCK